MQTDMKNRTVLVTGSTDGIGKETALQLARLGAQVLLHGRNREKGMEVVEEIRRSTGNDRLQFFQADLSMQKQVRKMAAEIRESNDRLHVLINNAGTLSLRGGSRRTDWRRHLPSTIWRNSCSLASCWT